MNQWERTPHLIYIGPIYDLKRKIRHILSRLGLMMIAYLYVCYVQRV